MAALHVTLDTSFQVQHIRLTYEVLTYQQHTQSERETHYIEEMEIEGRREKRDTFI
jgi:hypothetical protein